MPDQTDAPTLTPQQRIERLLAAAWQRARPEVQARLQALQQATEHHSADAQDAASIAHKLAGSLGMYGFPEGTRLARELELAWAETIPDRALCGHLTQELHALLFPDEPAVQQQPARV